MISQLLIVQGTRKMFVDVTPLDLLDGENGVRYEEVLLVAAEKNTLCVHCNCIKTQLAGDAT